MVDNMKLENFSNNYLNSIMFMNYAVKEGEEAVI